MRSDIWLVRVSAAILLVMVMWQRALDLSEAFRHRSLTLARIDIGIAIALLATAAALDVSLRRASTANPASGRFARAVAIVVLLTACSVALAIGLQPGLFLYSIAGAAVFCIGLAATAAAVIRIMGDRRFAAIGFAAVLYCAAAAAAFQIGAAQAVIALLNRT